MKNLIALGLLLFTIIGCEDFYTNTIDITESANVPTVVGRFVNTDIVEGTQEYQFENFGFTISRSRSVNETINLYENAEVRLIGSDGTDISYTNFEMGYHFPERVGSPPLFKRLSIEPNTTYDLTVELPGEETIRATSKTQAFGEIKNINIVKGDIERENEPSLDRLQIEIDDPLGENYYFLSVIYFGGHEEVGSPSRGFISPSIIIEGDPVLFDDDGFDGETIIHEIWTQPDARNTEEITNVVIYVWSLTKEDYEFRRSLELNGISEEDAFAKPIRVPSNIENGEGLFSMSKIKRFSIPWE